MGPDVGDRDKTGQQGIIVESVVDFDGVTAIIEKPGITGGNSDTRSVEESTGTPITVRESFPWIPRTAAFHN